MSDQTNLVAEVSPINAPEETQTLPLLRDDTHPDQFVIKLDGKLQPLSELQGKYNICIRNA